MRAALARGAPRPPPYQLLVLFLFTFTHCINILNWVFYINFLHTWANPAIIAAYLAFSIIGGIVFFLLASPIMYWTYFYADQISPKTRRNAFCAGITACFLLHGFPMEWIEVYLVWYYGWRSILSGISLLLVSFNFAIGFFVTWMGYTWLISRRLQLSSGATTAGNVPPSGGAPSRYVISSTS